MSHVHSNRTWLQAGFAVVLAAALSIPLYLPGCSPADGGNQNTNTNGNDNDNGNMSTMTIRQDTTMETLTVGAAEMLAVENGAVVTVTGDATVDGRMMAIDNLLTLKVDGDLVIGGTLTAMRDDAVVSDDTPFRDHPVGVHIIAAGAVTFGAAAAIKTNGSVVLTDDEGVLAMTPQEQFDQVEDVSGDELTTLVPLPPDNPAFDEPAPAARVRGSRGALPPVVISGVWPDPTGPAPAGDRPVIVFRFNGNRDLNLMDWTVNGPPAPDGADADPMNNTPPRPGKNGLRLNIWNNGGAINVQDVVFNLADGGDGGNDVSTCGTATGEDGGNSGNFRMTASGGINFNGPVTINPGRSGDGGSATVNKGAAGAAGCPGDTGDGATATGGDGADNRKRIFARGNVNGLANITLGDVIAGSGGPAMANACDGGPGLPCCDGGPGGGATATGGDGGEASLSISGLPLTPGDVIGGDGGDATAAGGDGGLGGSCKFLDGGDGGAGGAATAASGAGGNGSGGMASVGGDNGDATATGGSGGNGGDSGFGTPGGGGALGGAMTTAGAVGTGDTSGTAGPTDATDGIMGLPGGNLAVSILCIPIGNYVPGVPGPIDAGVFPGPVFDETLTTQLGTIEVEFVDTGGQFNYQLGANPAHVGIGDGRLDVRVSTLQSGAGSGVIGGLRIVPIQGFNINAKRPLEVRALNGAGEVVGQQTFDTIPDNFGRLEDPTVAALDALFNVDASVESFQILAPFDTFVTIYRIYLLDP